MRSSSTRERGPTLDPATVPSPRSATRSGERARERGPLLELDVGPGLVGAGEQVALAQVAAQADQRVAFVDGLDALGDHLDAQVAAQAHDRTQQLLLHR